MTAIKWLIRFKGIIVVYTENHMNPINKNAALLTVKVDVTYSYHSALRV
jgi:hypothetical protein